MALQQRSIKHKDKDLNNIKKAYEKNGLLKCVSGYEAKAAQNILRMAGLAYFD